MRLASTKSRKDKKGKTQCMQSNPFLEYYLLQLDWDALADITSPARALTDLVAHRMHAWGMSCPDTDTLKRASAITHLSRAGETTAQQQREWAWDVKIAIKILDHSLLQLLKS